MNCEKEWLLSSVFSEQKEMEEAEDKALHTTASVSSCWEAAEKRVQAAEREMFHCPEQRGERLPRILKEQWE